MLHMCCAHVARTSHAHSAVSMPCVLTHPRVRTSGMLSSYSVNMHKSVNRLACRRLSVTSVPGFLCLALCAWLSVPGSLCLALCVWLSVSGSLCLALCAWLSVPGSLCLALCAWLSVPVHQHLCSPRLSTCACSLPLLVSSVACRVSVRAFVRPRLRPRLFLEVGRVQGHPEAH